MMRDSLTLLKYETKRRPELARLAEGIEHLSEADIQNAEVPLPWMREALLRLKSKRQFDALSASADQWAVDGELADPIGVTRQWTGDETYIRVGRTELLMKPGQLIWLDRNGVWIDTIHTTHIDPKLRQTVFREHMTRSQYNFAIRQQARGMQAPTIEPIREEAPMFRFFRPG